MNLFAYQEKQIYFTFKSFVSIERHSRNNEEQRNYLISVFNVGCTVKTWIDFTQVLSLQSKIKLFKFLLSLLVFRVVFKQIISEIFNWVLGSSQIILSETYLNGRRYLSLTSSDRPWRSNGTTVWSRYARIGRDWSPGACCCDLF